MGGMYTELCFFGSPLVTNALVSFYIFQIISKLSHLGWSIFVFSQILKKPPPLFYTPKCAFQNFFRKGFWESAYIGVT